MEGKGLFSGLIPKATFSQVVNHPLTWAFIIITVMGASSFWLYTQKQNEVVKNLKIQIENCEQDVNTERKEKEEYQKQRDDLYNKLLFKQGYGDSVKTK